MQVLLLKKKITTRIYLTILCITLQNICIVTTMQTILLHSRYTKNHTNTHLKDFLKFC